MRKFYLKNVFTFVFLFVLTLINIVPANVYAAQTSSNGGDILIELKDVDLTEYEIAKKTDVVYFAEKGFNTDKFSLIVYIYNYGKKELVKVSESNVINLACKFDSNNNAVEYSNFRLNYISSLEDNSIYKFSVIDKDGILENTFKTQNNLIGKRHYKIAGVQLIGVGDVLATDYLISKEYIYCGYENGVSHTLDVVHTIELELNDVYYRTESSSKVHYQNQVNSVYFAVPNKYFEKGFTLNGIKAEWYEYKTQPIVVLENKDKFDVLNHFIGKDIGYYNSDIKYIDSNGNDSAISLTCGRQFYSNDAGGWVEYDWGYNVANTSAENKLNNVFVNKHDTKLSYLFYTNGKSYKDYVVESKALKDYIYNYIYNFPASLQYLPVKNGQVSADLFVSDVDNGHIRGYNEKIITVDDKFDLLDYNDSNSFWNFIIDYGFFNTLLGNVPGESTRTDLSPIHVVDINEDFKDISKIGYNLLMEEKFVNDFYKFVVEKSLEEIPKTTCLFRFSNTDYFIRDLDNDIGFETDGYIAQETVFLDFDVIHLDFCKNNEHVIYPVVASPIDVVPDITPPPNYESWLKYAILGISLSIAGLGIYNLFKRGN